MTLARGLTRLADGAAAVVWAPACAACSELLDRPHRGAVCDDCWRQVPWCGGRGNWHPYAAAGWYEGSLRSIIHAFKYEGRRSLARPLAALMQKAAGEWLLDIDLVVPVPLHPWRHWRRGFNQARELGVLLGPPLADLLRRTRHTAPQMSLAASARQANVRDAFRLSDTWLRRGPQLDGRRVLLADDVMTTGATLDACRKVLRAAGAADVRGVTVARVAALRLPPRPRRRRSRAVLRPPAPRWAAPLDGDSSL